MMSMFVLMFVVHPIRLKDSLGGHHTRWRGLRPNATRLAGGSE